MGILPVEIALLLSIGPESACGVDSLSGMLFPDRLPENDTELQQQLLQIAENLTIHYRDSGGNGLPALLLLHSLSDNTHVFDALVAAGLSAHFRLIIPDLRGRGDSSRPEAGYAQDDHCSDLIALLDALRLDAVYVAGHSFGGYLGLYFAAHAPERVKGLCLIDTADELHPLTPMFVVLMSDRLGRWYPSESIYLQSLRSTPYITYWDEHMRTSFLADTERLPDGSLYVKTQKRHIAQCAADIYRMDKRDWRRFALGFRAKALVISARDPFMQGQHIVPHQNALETAVLFPQGAYEEVSGNHVTMLFGRGAAEITALLIERFSEI